MTKEKKSFTITRSKGVHLAFKNGYYISIQWGMGNYCDSYDHCFSMLGEGRDSDCQSNTAEIGIFNGKGNWVTRKAHKDVTGEALGDDVIGYLSLAEVLKYINWTASRKKQKS